MAALYSHFKKRIKNLQQCHRICTPHSPERVSVGLKGQLGNPAAPGREPRLTQHEAQLGKSRLVSTKRLEVASQIKLQGESTVTL